MTTVHQHFRLDDRHQPGFLAQRGIARQRMGIRIDAGTRRNLGTDRDHGAPLAEFRTQFDIFGQALAQTIQTLGDLLAFEAGHVLGTRVDLDPRQDSGGVHQFGQRRAVRHFLAQRLIEQDRPRDMLTQALGGQHHRAIGQPVFFGVVDADCIEALLDRAHRLVDRQNALARGHHGLGNRYQLFQMLAHGPAPSVTAPTAPAQ